MKKRIVICADGTWNRPENDVNEDFASNVLKLARAIKPFADDGVSQQVFYDWGIASYYSTTLGGITGKGMHKNIMDNYRYIVQNYSEGDDIYLFGFSRGAYTVRALCGLIYNCGILKRHNAVMIQQAFDNYKKSSVQWSPKGKKSIAFRQKHSYPSNQVKFVGVWDTVGGMGIPISFLGLFEDKDEFYDTKIGQNVSVARHALAIDEHREDFKVTLWKDKEGLDLKQVWFSGSHSDVGGSYQPDEDGSLSSDHTLEWMAKEALIAGLESEGHLYEKLNINPLSKLHDSRRSFYRLKGRHFRKIDHGKTEVLIHPSVKQRWDLDSTYRPQNLKAYVDQKGWTGLLN